VLLNEDLIRDPLALLQLLSALVVHTEIELLPCGKYWSIFSKAIDKALAKWDLDSVIKALETSPTTSTAHDSQSSLLEYSNNSMTIASRRVLTQVLNQIGDADSFNSVMLRLRELVESTRDKVCDRLWRQLVGGSGAEAVNAEVVDKVVVHNRWCGRCSCC